MMTTNEAIMVLGMMAVTFSVRYLPLAFVGRLPLPKPVFRALRFVPVAVLTAIIVPIMFMPSGKMDIHYSNAYLVAGVVAVLVSWRSKNLLLTIIVGMVFFLGWRALLGA